MGTALAIIAVILAWFAGAGMLLYLCCRMMLWACPRCDFAVPDRSSAWTRDRGGVLDED